VILFARNVENPKQLAQLTAQLHNAAPEPILIAIDQEGGTVARGILRIAKCDGALE